MKRLYTSAEFLQFIEHTAKRVPDILIGTDIMIGFPGESDPAFQASCDMLQNSPLAYAHVFAFSERGGTAATRLSDKVSPADKKARSAILHRLSEKKKLGFYQRFLGRQLRVLTEAQNEYGQWLGFSDNYVKVAIPAGNLSANSLIKVRMASVSKEVGVGEVASER
jgi:threonylcarbamoyladenosine tRNA methylthiotransferase MtaB